MDAKVTLPAYSSPYSYQHLVDIAHMQDQRIKQTEDNIQSIKEQIQKNIDPQIAKVFNSEVKTLVDLFA